MNERESFWRGEFGDAYHQRSPGNPAANVAFFRRVLGRGLLAVLDSAIELGCGTGANLAALKQLAPAAELAGVELHDGAAAEAARFAHILRRSILGFEPEKRYELAFTKGVLIHIAPDDLPKAYDALYCSASRYVLIAEYYSPTPVEIPYRGHAGRLWKRDFAGELMDRYPDLYLLDYGFAYHRDCRPQDDLNWFLFEKTRRP